MVAKSENMGNTTVSGKGLDYHNGMAFTATNRDQDERDTANCAAQYGGGGWWYKDCVYANLNGKKTTTGSMPVHGGMRYTDVNDYAMISSSEMRMIRVG